MAVANRKYGKNLSLFGVGGNALAPLISEATIDFSFSLVDGTVLNDLSTANIPNRQEYRIGFTLVFDDADSGLSAVIDAVGTAVAFSVTVSGSGEVYAGTGILSTGTHSIPDGGQTVAFEIVSNGTLMTTT